MYIIIEKNINKKYLKRVDIKLYYYTIWPILQTTSTIIFTIEIKSVNLSSLKFEPRAIFESTPFKKKWNIAFTTGNKSPNTHTLQERERERERERLKRDHSFVQESNK